MLFSSVQFSSVTQACLTLCDPMNRSMPGLPGITDSRSLPRLISIESVMPSSHLILCHPLLLLPPIPPSVRVFSNESTLRMRWPKYWSWGLYLLFNLLIFNWRIAALQYCVGFCHASAQISVCWVASGRRHHCGQCLQDPRVYRVEEWDSGAGIPRLWHLRLNRLWSFSASVSFSVNWEEECVYFTVGGSTEWSNTHIM